jgi:phage head maturation protease
MNSAHAQRPDTDEVLTSLNELMEIVTVAMPAYLRAQDPRVIRAQALIARLKGEIN